MHTAIQHHIQAAIPAISSQDLAYMVSLFQARSIEKDGYFLEFGKRCQEVAFVNSGMLRVFYPNEKGEDTSCYFAMPSEFITSFSSLANDTPSIENIQAILPTELLVISKQNLEMLYRQVPASQELGRKSAERIAIMMEKRIAMFMTKSAKDRYRFILEHQPALLQNVPLQYLASYLGITPQHLSRLRSQK